MGEGRRWGGREEYVRLGFHASDAVIPYMTTVPPSLPPSLPLGPSLAREGLAMKS